MINVAYNSIQYNIASGLGSSGMKKEQQNANCRMHQSRSQKLNDSQKKLSSIKISSSTIVYLSRL